MRNGKRNGRRLGLLALPVAAAALAIAPASASALDCFGTKALGGGPSIWQPESVDSGFNDAELFDVFVPPRDDAFDHYGQPMVDGSGYSNPDTGACTRDGRTLRFPAYEVIADVIVKPEIYVARKRPMGRVLAAIKNTGDSPVTVDFGWENDLGSDDNTRVASTSSGNATVEPADRWATTCDDAPADGCAPVATEPGRDPELAHNWEKKGGKAESADVIDLATGDGTWNVTFEDITVGPGATKVFVQVVHLGKTIRAARKAAVETDGAPSFVYAGLTKSQLRKLQNW